MRRRFAALILVVLAFPVFACSEGGECDLCETDEDCHSDYVCVAFTDGSHRCGSGVGTTECRVP